MCRELEEESGIISNKEDLEKVAVIDFYFDDVPKENDWNQTVHVFLLKKWKNDPIETEEMRPEWYYINSLPENMWIDDPYWLPRVLRKEKIRAEFHFTDSGKKIINYKIDTVQKFE